MEGHGNPLNATEAVLKRPRSVASRKPRSKEQLVSEYKDISCTPSSRSISPDDDGGVEGSGHRRKELYLNGPESRGSTPHRSDASKKIKRDDRAGGDHDGHNKSSKSKDAKRSSEGVLALACTKNSGSPDGQPLPPKDASVPTEHKVRKVKLKVSGITRPIQTKTIQEANDDGKLSTSDGSVHRHKQKDSGGQKHHQDKHDVSPSSDLVRKSKRVPKKRTLDGDSGDEDGRSGYLVKFKIAKVVPEQSIATNHAGVYDESPEDDVKKKKLVKVSKNKSLPYEVDEDFTMSRSGRDGRKKLKLGDGSDFIEEEEPEMDEPKKRLSEADSPSDVKNETPGLITRQRALQGRGGNGDTLIEFPDGLPTASSRKQKEKLSEVEVQAKKAEAAQRRKMQVEKAEREQQAEAMRKILGIDTEKKKEEKKQKERDEKEKQEKIEEYKRNCIQCVMGPEGTVVTFPENMGLPSIFNSKPTSYPPPREKCAGPSCTNPYKYRDSKTKLPLCSLQCYKAVQGSSETLTC
ncbi:INO80 complex subunit B-like [Oryza brachyantha]|uniref:INO80 complex subunit B-like conserved region domain-containing protein n=1 Tax=Oryza brachyantha TaxID=4533 RepID=J3LU20_ORYBR|nr:INO80 complex subunit B-like [Oryza brachyantha]